MFSFRCSLIQIFGWAKELDPAKFVRIEFFDQTKGAGGFPWDIMRKGRSSVT